MTLSPMVINGLLIGGMIVVLLLILGALGALLTGPRKAATPVPLWAGNEGADLDDRLQNLSAGKFSGSAAERDATGPATARATTAARPSPATSRLTPPAPASEAPAAPSARLALPDSGRSQTFTPPPSGSPVPGLNPLAARFSSLDLAASSAPNAAPTSGRATPQTGPVDGARNGHTAPPARNGSLPHAAERTAHPGANSRPDQPALPPERSARFTEPPQAEPPAAKGRVDANGRLSPADTANRFTEMPQAETRSAPPTPDLVVTRELPAAPQSPTQRLGLPGTVASDGLEQGAGQRAASFDIQALLRGDTVQAPPAALPPSGPLDSAPARPRYSTGQLSSPSPEGAPIGAVPFNPNLLQVRDPVASPPSMPEEAPPTHATMPAPETNYQAPNDAAGRGFARYDEAPAERMVAPGLPNGYPRASEIPDLDATRLVDDFDLPDTEFETHVFSTAELVEDNALGTFAYPSVVADIQEAAPIAFSSGPLSDAAPHAAEYRIPHPQAATSWGGAAEDDEPDQARQQRSDMDHARLQPVLDELAALAEVAFARLIDADGTVMLAAGTEEALEPDMDRRIIALLNTAIMEEQQLELGACGSLAVEAPAAALLLSPLPGGACLAVMLGNPSRLGLLRRQVRKPLAALRAILSEHGIS